MNMRHRRLAVEIVTAIHRHGDGKLRQFIALNANRLIVGVAISGIAQCEFRFVITRGDLRSSLPIVGGYAETVGGQRRFE